MNSESLCAPGDQPEKKEREREKARHGDQSSDGAKVFQYGVGIYTVVILSKDKD